MAIRAFLACLDGTNPSRDLLPILDNENENATSELVDCRAGYWIGIHRSRFGTYRLQDKALSINLENYSQASLQIQGLTF